MDIVPLTAELASAAASDAFDSSDAPHSSLRGDAMALDWLFGARGKSEQLSVRLPGAGTVRVDVEKHVDKALKGKTNELANGSKPSKPSGPSKT